ncbi:hypothetical protein ACH427_04015 [Streptomyces sp. NPDC020379]|uniref:hypothetical protein n=1 Tax=Streptomyces sp. NPDC020379 TaxID=3365071 RepID=UPI0037B8CAD8
MSGPNAFYERLSESLTDIPDPIHGGSGYFSEPSRELDPNLFDGDHIKPDVRDWILTTVRNFFDRYKGFDDWAEVWLAGSGISYQWAADRGNGDLDVLIGIDFAKFVYDNPKYKGLTSEEVADMTNASMRASLWPETAHTKIGNRDYEVTFYWNAARGTKDITAIRPYAAYSLTKNQWTIQPPELPEDPRNLYPTEYTEAADQDERQARHLIDRYRDLQQQLAAVAKGSPGWMTTATHLKKVIANAAQLYDSIHLGRHQAFSPNGDGYGDFDNFRWQSAKERGITTALREIKGIGATAQELTDTQLYGQPIADAQQALINAALWGTR